MLEELSSLFESDTIRPSYLPAHIILALYIFNDHEDGLGRYRLKNELTLGAGTARTLITRLNEKSNFIKVKNDENKRKGHILTKEGEAFLKKIKQRIPLISKGDTTMLQGIIIDYAKITSYFCLVRNAARKISTGIDQRDAAIKIGGLGATCLIYDGTNITFPSYTSQSNTKDDLKVEKKVTNYFLSKFKENNIKLEKNDVILVGLANDLKKARLATLNSALTLI